MTRSDNPDMTKCERCKEFKDITYYEPLNAWVCFDCAKEIDEIVESNFNPSRREERKGFNFAPKRKM